MPVIDGTTYHSGTPQKVIQILEDSRRSARRIRLHYGDTKTGRDWLEENDVTGHISRSTGPVKIPIMIANARSSGGPGILDHCIVKIRDTHGNVLWKHAKYHHGVVATGYDPDSTHPWRVFVDRENHANFTTREKRIRWLQKMDLPAIMEGGEG